MRQSLLFTEAKREAPKDEVSLNAKLLIQAGFIKKEMAGVYSFLPLGLKVLKKIENIIREEMNAVGGQEILMPALQPKEPWQKTGRFETMTDLFKLKDMADRDFVLGPTHEEIVVPLAAEFINSYKDLPFAVYQIQGKFRSELRAKSGLLRGREFIMKDMYSFHRDPEDLQKFYDLVAKSYKKIFDRVGIGEKTFITFASGGTFSKYSHEFQTLTPYGEDTIYLDKKKNLAVNKEVFNDAVLEDIGLERRDLIEEKSIEVGNIFLLKVKFTEAFGVKYKNEKGECQPVFMGCYGIGLPRLMGTVVEVLADDKGLVWPKGIAPFLVHLVALQPGVLPQAEKIYEELSKQNREVLFDDRSLASPGEKLVESDLLGLPARLVLSERNKDKIEVKLRNEAESKLLSQSGALKFVKEYAG